MELGEGDKVITYGNSHTFHEHSVADLISSCFFHGLCRGDQQVAGSSARTYGPLLGDIRLKNDYFEQLANKLQGCITDGDLRLAAIMPACLYALQHNATGTSVSLIPELSSLCHNWKRMKCRNYCYTQKEP